MNPYINSLNGFGGGFVAFWPGQGVAVERPTGGYEYLKYLPYREREEVEEIVSEIAAKASYSEPSKVEIEIGLRLRLKQKDLKYRKRLLEIAYQEALKEFKRREEEEITLLLMML